MIDTAKAREAIKRAATGKSAHREIRSRLLWQEGGYLYASNKDYYVMMPCMDASTKCVCPVTNQAVNVELDEQRDLYHSEMFSIPSENETEITVSKLAWVANATAKIDVRFGIHHVYLDGKMGKVVATSGKVLHLAEVKPTSGEWLLPIGMVREVLRVVEKKSKVRIFTQLVPNVKANPKEETTYRKRCAIAIELRGRGELIYYGDCVDDSFPNYQAVCEQRSKVVYRIKQLPSKNRLVIQLKAWQKGQDKELKVSTKNEKDEWHFRIERANTVGDKFEETFTINGTNTTYALEEIKYDLAQLVDVLQMPCDTVALEWDETDPLRSPLRVIGEDALGLIMPFTPHRD